MVKRILFLFLMLFFLRAASQTYNMKDTTIIGCGGVFYDSGGPGANYSDYESVTMTFASSANNCVRVTFTSFNLQAGDVLRIYDGPNNGYPLIASYTGTATPPSTLSGWAQSLTFVFTSNGAGNSAGWEATISCAPCMANQDCIYKKFLCGTSTFNDNNIGPGTNANEVAGVAAGCLGGPPAEVMSSWYTFSIATAGTLTFSIDPVNGLDDYDFALWGPNPNCPPTAAPLRCSTKCYGNIAWCGGSSAPAPNTGLSLTATDISEAPGTPPPPGPGDGYVRFINVTPGERYIIMVNNSSGQPLLGFTFNFGGTATLAPCPTATVPVELLSFKASAVGADNVQLRWHTASESENSYFVLERSDDSYNFERCGGLIRAAGNSISRSDYSYIDKVKSPGIYYYRLKAIGTSGESRIVSQTYVDMTRSFTGLLSVHPRVIGQGNMTTELKYISPVPGVLSVSIRDIVGRVVYRTDHGLDKGVNTIGLDLSHINLENSVYLLQIDSPQGSEVHKMIISK
jgi:hypothetical protein